MNGYAPEGFRIGLAENTAALTPNGLFSAFIEGRILEGRALLCDNAGNLHVELADGIIGIIPREEAVFPPSERNIAVLSRVGKPVCFKVIGLPFSAGSMHPVLSRAAAQRDCFEQYVKNLIPGDIIDAVVTHLSSFGAFADVGCGLCSLLPIDCISVSRISHPSERFAVGNRIHAIVRANERDYFRLTLSHRELLGTWEENAARFTPGMTVTGIVRGSEEYGVFVELAPNLAGLAEARPDTPDGSAASVYIKSILPSKMKIKLSIVDVFERPPLPKAPEYFLDSGHMDYWQYSPPSAPRMIFTDFTKAP